MTTDLTAGARSEALFPHVPGLEGFWAYATLQPGASPSLTQSMRVMVGMLGLGLEQALSHLMRERPSLSDLQLWIVETAGYPNPLALERYVAMLNGDPVPAACVQKFQAIDAMDPVLDEVELMRWERDGYAILRQAITPEETAAAARLVWQVANANPDEPASWYAPRAQGIMLQNFQSAEQEAARRSPRVHKAFAQLWGTADLWPSVDRLGFSPPVTPDAPFRATPLHWDCSLQWPIPYNMFGVLYLSDTREDQGALRLVPAFQHELESWLEDLGDVDPRKIELTDRAIHVAGKAGDLIICRHELPHGASPNHSDCPRLVQYLTMYPSWLTEQELWR